MSLIDKVKTSFETGGVQSVAAGGFRFIANRLDHHPAEVNPVSAAATNRTSEFLTWVRFAVPGMLENGNVDAMEYALANMPKGSRILEIGSFCGLSTVVINYLMDRAGMDNVMFTSDKWEFESQKKGEPLGDSPTMTHDAYREYVKGSFLRNLKTFAPHRLPHTIECFSDEFFSRWFAEKDDVDVFGRPVKLGGELGFCYIDGNHTYDYAKRDFDNTDKALMPGGYILFDDCADGSHWEVNRLVREIAAGNRYELVAKMPNYLFRKC